jgi:hypothetical protein
MDGMPGAEFHSPSNPGDDLPPNNTVSELANPRDTQSARNRPKRGRSKAQALGSEINTGVHSNDKGQAPMVSAAEPAEPGQSLDPAFEGVFQIERLLEKQWSGKVLWLKIKWIGVPKGSWERAEHIKEDLGEEAYQELLETKPRKRRKKAGKW